MVMDGSKIIDSLDALWFFSNVFTSSSRSEEQVEEHVKPELTDKEEATTKHMNQVEESQQNDETPGGENLVRRCTKCGEFAAEIESLKVVVGQVGEAAEELAYKTQEKKKIRRRRRRSKRRLLSNERRQVFGELDLGFYGQMEYPSPSLHHHESPWLLDDQETIFEYEKLRIQQKQHHHHHVNMNMNMNMKKMPPLNDGLAMKQHLKSWAYAVACTVR